MRISSLIDLFRKKDNRQQRSAEEVREVAKTVDMSLPEKHPASGYDGIYADEDDFRGLAKRCALGDADAMLRMSNMLKDAGQEEYMLRGARMWLIRASVYGSGEAREKLEAVPDNEEPYLSKQFMIPGEGNAKKRCPGEVMRKLGLLDFTEDDEYELFQLNKDRIYVASRYIGYDSADEDGFGMEDYYDYYFFDEYFCLLFKIAEWSHSGFRNNQYRIVPTCRQRRREKQEMRNKGIL
ncbi:MAG: hypothetical protein IJT96_00305 [Lachnospiraceae bacterium]|nr:hypothetical protein [Lachnospiraceae bacterium]